jgi:hypothetical protein
MDRQQQSSKPPKPPGDGGDLGGHQDQDDNLGSGSRKDGDGYRGSRPGRDRGHGEGGSDELQGSSGEKGPSHELVPIDVHGPCLRQSSDEPDEHQKMIHVASDRDVLLLYLRYDVYDSLIPASFVRSAPSIMRTHEVSNSSIFPTSQPQLQTRGMPDSCSYIGNWARRNRRGPPRHT